MKTIRNLGRVLTILAAQEAQEYLMHADVDAFHAPSECHDLVARGEAQRMRATRRHAEGVAGCKMRDIQRQARLRGGIQASISHPRWQDFVGRVADRMGGLA